MKVKTALAVCLMCSLISCGTVTVESLHRYSELYASRVVFGWENLGSFQLRGNARLHGSNLVARGPFVLWGDADRELLRGDFYGPDGRPVVSIKSDSAGMLIYMPQDEYAAFMPGGLQAGCGTIPTIDLIHLLRTGYPLVMESWEIVSNASVADEKIKWLFCVPDSTDRMVLTMETGDIFPSECKWRSGEYLIHGSSPHDEYNAWPWSWSTRIYDSVVNLELTEVNTTTIPGEGIWDMTVPIPVDTVDYVQLWQPLIQSDRR